MQLWTYTRKDGSSPRFEAHADCWRTKRGAEQAAKKWREGMADLDTPSTTQICELVDDGRCGRKHVEVGEPVSNGVGQ